ncbi:hypothetical protein VARIO8X_60310 [Burkholderiales bacterium 8X]|nr:hypothetical protein VARIO8X_60310 [Burkholderiales bacterium 8X]
MNPKDLAAENARRRLLAEHRSLELAHRLEANRKAIEEARENLQKILEEVRAARAKR